VRAALAAALALAGVAGVLGARPAPSISALPYYADRDFTPHWGPVEHRVRAFCLVTQQGRALSEADLDGRIHVASFFYTGCPGVCPALVSRLRRVQEATRAFPDVELVSYSVTPRSDTPETLAEFGRLRGVDPDRWLLVTGDLATITRLARESYFADDARALPAGSGERPLLHSEKVLLVDGQRRLRGIYEGTQAFEIERLLQDIATLRRAPL
jgi:protein SCO1/2